MDLSNVPFFQRPMSASKEDKPTGNMDEAGNIEYVSKTGQTYFVKPAADQRTTRTKVEEDVVPALKDFAANPSLPSADQMKQFGVDVVEGTYEGIKGAVEGTGTMGDVFGVAPTIAAASAPFEIPEGSVRSFGGKSKNVAPRFKMRGEATSFPNPTFGNKKLRDLFEDDQWENQFLDFKPEQEGVINESPLFVNPDNGDTFDNDSVFSLGYAPNLRVHDLADIAIGRKTPEEALDYVGMDPEPNLVNYVNQRMSDLQERPEFQEYLERYRGLNEEYDPYELLQKNPRTGNEVATFRSPIPEVLSSIEFPKNGIKGSQLLKEFQDNPSIRNSELKSLGVDIDPQQRYSKDEIDNLFEGKLWNASAYLVDEPLYPAYQRQQVLDPTVDYFELVVNADKQSGDNFKAISQHFENNTLSHARASVKEDRMTGQDYILLEELQSDLLQKGFESPVGDLTEALDKNLTARLGYSPDQSWKDYIAESNFTETLGLHLAGIGPRNFEGGDDEFFEIWGSLEDLLVDSREYGDFRYEAAQAASSGSAAPNIKEFFIPKQISAPPIQKTEEGVRLAFDGLLAEAANRDINRIVIPPFERIVAERFTPGTNAYFKALQPSSGFYATYKKAIDKILKEYEQEFGRENFSTRLVDLDYPPVGYLDPNDPNKVKTVDLPMTGTEVFFKGAVDKGYDFTAPRFAEGGLVQNYNQGGSVSMDEQMKLFQEGGIADEGMNRDPISGNEVPPGSLASEVRDDVDAKLSEGEYVVPADVVRYYGVAYFEKLRNKAKAGLADMEADGRIGGEPMPEGLGGEDELPFSDEELMSFDDGGPIEMAEGGSVMSKFNPQAFQPGFSFGMGGGGTGGMGGGVVTKTYRNAAGEIRSIMFVNGQPIQSIPAGFYEDTPENRAKFATPETTTPTGVAPVSTGSEPDGSGGTITSAGSGGGGGYSGVSEDMTGLFSDPSAVSPAMSGAISQGQLLGGALGAVQGLLSGSLFGAAVKGYQGAQKGGAKGAENTVAEALATAETFSNLGRNDLAQQYSDIANQVAKENNVTVNSSLQSKAQEIAKEATEAMTEAAPPGMSFGVTSTSELGYTAESGRGGTGKGGVTDVTGTPSGFAPGSIATTGVPESVQASIAAQRGAQPSASSVSSSGRSGSVTNAKDAAARGMGGSVGGASAPGGVSGSGSGGTATEGYGSFGGAGGPSDGGGGGGGGGKVICTALNSLGLLPDDVYKLDQEFGHLANLQDPALTKGYRRWATPVAEYIKKDSLLSKVTRYAIKPLANAWAKEMAHQMEPANYRGSILGKLLMAIGHPICRKLGKE